MPTQLPSAPDASGAFLPRFLRAGCAHVLIGFVPRITAALRNWAHAGCPSAALGCARSLAVALGGVPSRS